MGMRLGTIDVSLGLLLQAMLGDQAEAMRAVEIVAGGQAVRVLVKAPDERMPDGIESEGAPTVQIPHLTCEIIEHHRSVQFRKL